MISKNRFSKIHHDFSIEESFHDIERRSSNHVSEKQRRSTLHNKNFLTSNESIYEEEQQLAKHTSGQSSVVGFKDENESSFGHRSSGFRVKYTAIQPAYKA